MTFTLSSAIFEEGDPIPEPYTCDGAGLSPPLDWSGAPTATRSFAIILEDPDAPGPAGEKRTFVHWLVYNIPATTDALSLGAGGGKDLPAGAMEGRNDGDRSDYFPPCPPQGRHRYVFRIHALDFVLRGQKTLTKADLEEAIAGHVLATATLWTNYTRERDSVAVSQTPA